MVNPDVYADSDLKVYPVRGAVLCRSAFVSKNSGFIQFTEREGEREGNHKSHFNTCGRERERERGLTRLQRNTSERNKMVAVFVD